MGREIRRVAHADYYLAWYRHPSALDASEQFGYEFHGLWRLLVDPVGHPLDWWTYGGYEEVMRNTGENIVKARREVKKQSRATAGTRSVMPDTPNYDDPSWMDRCSIKIFRS